MNLIHQFNVLGNKQLNIQDGINMQKELLVELNRYKLSAENWGFVAVMSNLTLVPLNIIVNAFELKKAITLFQILTRHLYSQFSQSGTRIDGHIAIALNLLKQEIINDLTKRE